MTIPPARVGDPLSAIETPALLVDLDAYERNLDRMTRSLAGSGVRLRPHAKTHKCPIIARHQVERGAVGVCCQTIGEAEAMVLGGVRDVLITNQIVTPGKIRRLVGLAKQADVMACVDSAGNVADLADAASVRGVCLPVLVEVDVGQHRCGVEPGGAAAALARVIAERPSLRFAGIHAYHGGAQHLYDEGERRAALDRVAALVRETIAALTACGLGPEIVTGGGTGTYPMEAASGVYNEVQPGSYVFMDGDYRNVAGAPRAFEQALFVLTTVLSARPDRAVCDAGLKASSTDSGLPTVCDRGGVLYVGASDEHGSLAVDVAGEGPIVGERLRLVPGHCDPTVNLHDWLVGVRGGIVESIWPVAARGA